MEKKGEVIVEKIENFLVYLLEECYSPLVYFPALNQNKCVKETCHLKVINTDNLKVMRKKIENILYELG